MDWQLKQYTVKSGAAVPQTQLTRPLPLLGGEAGWREGNWRCCAGPTCHLTLRGGRRGGEGAGVVSP